VYDWLRIVFSGIFEDIFSFKISFFDLLFSPISFISTDGLVASSLKQMF